MTRANFVTHMLGKIVSKTALEYVMNMNMMDVKTMIGVETKSAMTRAGTRGQAGIHGREAGGMTKANFVQNMLGKIVSKKLKMMNMSIMSGVVMTMKMIT